MKFNLSYWLLWILPQGYNARGIGGSIGISIEVIQCRRLINTGRIRFLIVVNDIEGTLMGIKVLLQFGHDFL
jgi:hypothetical protein